MRGRSKIPVLTRPPSHRRRRRNRPVPRSEAVKGRGGALRGAAGGAAIGAIAGDAGAGAGIGAITGTMVGGRQARQQRDARNQQAVTQQQDLINTFYRGFGACMEGRGYTIK
jgi:uncharacterized membrane protein